MPLVYGQRNATRTARRPKLGAAGKVQALPQLRETGELIDSGRGAQFPAKNSARSSRRSPRQPRSNPGAVAGGLYPDEQSKLEGLPVHLEELLAPLDHKGARAHAKRSHPGSRQKKLPSVRRQHPQYPAMDATFSTATPAMTPQSALGYDLPTSRTSGDFYASSNEFEQFERQLQHHGNRPSTLSTASQVTTPQTALSSLGYDVPASHTSGDFYASSSEFADFTNTAGFGGWYAPQHEASDPDDYMFDRPGHALGLWAMASPTLPPAPFARKIFDRKPKKGVRELHFSRHKPMPDDSETSTGEHSGRRTMHILTNFQSGGSSPSSSAIRSSRSTSAERAARRDARREAEKGFTEVHSARSRRPTLSSASKAKDSPRSVDEHKTPVADQNGASAEKIVIIGDTKLKLTRSNTLKSVLAELDSSSLPPKRTRRKTMLPAYLNSKASPTHPVRIGSLDRVASGGSIHDAATGFEDDQGSLTHGRQHSSGAGGESGRSDQIGQEHASISSLKAHEVKSHQDNSAKPKPPPPPPPPIAEDMVADAFKKLQEHNEIHEDDLARALELCGYVMPRADWIKQVSGSLTQYSTMNLEEFRSFVEGYSAMQHDAYKKAFEESDCDGSGLVEHSELELLLRSFGIEPMKHVMEEVLAEVDEDGRGELDLHEFEHLMDVLLSREGFTKTEYEEFLYLFKRFDRDGSGEIDVKELIAMINWLGYTVTPSDLKAIIAEVDVDGSGEINRREFLVCMRKLRDRTLKLVMDVIKANDEDGSGTIDRKELLSVLRGLGYEVADSAAIDESQMDAGLGAVEELGLSELWRILAVFRLREGMTNEEVKSICAAFDTQDKDGSGELETLEAPGALRELGYKCEFSVVQNVLGKVDVDDTGALDQVEFRKMVRMLQARDFESYRAAFRECDTENNKVISQEIAVEAMASLGFAGTPEELFLWSEVIPMVDHREEDSQPKNMVNIDGFVGACDRHAKQMRQIFMRNGGWSDEEVEYYRQIFARYDVWGQGEISNKELVRLVEDTIPEMASDRAMRPQLLWLMRQVHEDLRGSLSFRDFLKLMSLFREFQDKERANKEQLAVKETGFSQQEVAEFRELFLASDVNCVGELNFSEVWEMVNAVTPLGDVLSTQLQGMFEEATTRTSMNDDQEHQADFPELLRLMKKLLDIDFAGIKEKTEICGLSKS